MSTNNASSSAAAATKSTSNNSGVKSNATKSANKRARHANQQSSQGTADKAKVIVSPRPPVASGSAKDGSASHSRRQDKNLLEGNNSKGGKQREEAKTIEAGAASSGSAGQAKRASRTSAGNNDVLKQSIKSEKVIKSQLNSKKGHQKDKSSAAVATTEPSIKQSEVDAMEERKDEESGSHVRLRNSDEGKSTSSKGQHTGSESQATKAHKNLDDIKTVSFV